MSRDPLRPVVTIAVLAKAPVPGQVKTRLCPPYTLEQAAALAAAALEDTLAAVLQTPGAGPPVLVLDGDADTCPTAGFAVRSQRGTGLDERISNAVTDVHRERGGPVLLVGMDTPQLTGTVLAGPVALLAAGTQSVLGPAADGGYWAIGLQRPDPSVVVGVPMSTATTGARQLERLRAAGLSVELLPVLVDVDDAASARAVAEAAPTTRFARLYGRIAPGAAA
ncbi:MAG: TIGR04282 family arsenosugar biosynthesis glycosyltransferase [Actinomycetes bacterium]